LNVTVIGGAGKMGRWLTHHFINQGLEVTISDVRSDEAVAFAKSVGARFSEKNIIAVANADLTVLSTPIPVTPQVLREIYPYLKKDSVVAEISSLKSQVIPVLIEICGWNVRPVSIHPLFGPGARLLEREKLALIPLVDPSFEVELVKKLFPGVEVIVVDAEEHDRAMALTLSLPHFINIIFASTINDEDLNVLKKLGGTTFTLQLTLSESVMNEDAELYTSIQINNEYTSQYLAKFLTRYEMAREWITKKDEEKFAEFYASVQGALSRDEDFHNAYERMYRALEIFQKP